MSRQCVTGSIEETPLADGPAREPLSAAARKRRQRRRLQAAGLTAVEVWVPPEHRPAVRRFERLLRLGIVPPMPTVRDIDPKGELAMDLNLLRETLDEYTSDNGYTFRTRTLDGEAGLEVVVEDRDEFPILLSADDEQTLCLTYLWDEAQVKQDKRTALLTTLLEMNVPLPLSSFGKVADRYVIFGALTATASTEDLVVEIETLSDNTLEVLEVVAPYLN